MLKLYNTLNRHVEEFKPIKDKQVGIYACGPTVYHYVHIGNLRTFVLTDILARVLKFDGYKVKLIMNITDVGHLTGDNDRGDDKLEKGARREGKTVWDVAKFYEKAFLADIKTLNIKKPSKLPRATEHIKEQIKLIKQLVERGYAYDAPEAVYFDVAKFPDYDRLSGQKLDEKKTRARAEIAVDKHKKNPADFALWFKRVGKFKNHTMYWPSPWGPGFPGWHVECSAMSVKYLGQPFDIHTGGVDLITPHHTNEIAQSTADAAKPLANFWVHGEHLLLRSGKMAKTDGNAVTLAEIVKSGISPLAFRYLVLGAHYRSKLNFSMQSLEAAQNALDNLYDKISELQGAPSVAMCEDYYRAFVREINNDLDMPRTISLLWRLIKQPNPDKLKLSTIKKFDEVLGLDLLKGAAEIKKIPAEIKKLAQNREHLRQQKKFGEADEIRRQLEAAGYAAKDSPAGPILRKV